MVFLEQMSHVVLPLKNFCTVITVISPTQCHSTRCKLIPKYLGHSSHLVTIMTDDMCPAGWLVGFGLSTMSAVSSGPSANHNWILSYCSKQPGSSNAGCHVHRPGIKPTWLNLVSRGKELTPRPQCSPMCPAGSLAIGRFCLNESLPYFYQTTF